VWEVQIRKLREVDSRGKGEELEGPKKELLCATLICYDFDLRSAFSHPNTFRLVMALDGRLGNFCSQLERTGCMRDAGSCNSITKT
jgi:hypothetical protein